MQLIRNSHWYYRKHGVAQLLRRTTEKLLRMLLWRSETVFVLYDDSSADHFSVAPDSLSVHSFVDLNSIPQDIMEYFVLEKGDKAYVASLLNRFFKSDAVLWVAILQGRLAGYAWTVTRDSDHYYCLPLSERDAAVLSLEILPSARGQSISAHFIHRIGASLSVQGIDRLYASTLAWNTSMQKAALKTRFKWITKLWHLRMMDWHVSIRRSTARQNTARTDHSTDV